MTPKKAIEILSSANFYTTQPSSKSEVEAVKLGIEALKSIKAEHILYGYDRIEKLPGEE